VDLAILSEEHLEHRDEEQCQRNVLGATWLFVNKCSLGTAPVHDFFEGAAGKVRTYFSLFLLIYADKEYLHRGHKPKEGEREREYIKSNSLATN
jgi:hypothetical protein